ncbi:hypothetical protein [Vampirovibrio sp.]|uniref:hypothetical protein n=1 Tax=Vampirovibrio sp. TaxID=2717857 RepID=UPI00359401C5
MARILDNMNGRRMIRLSPDDVLNVVSLYQQQLYGLEQRDYQSIQTRLRQTDFYLPEEV